MTTCPLTPAQQAKVVDSLPLVNHVLRSFRSRIVDSDDALQAGCIGLMNACRRDPATIKDWRGYASTCIWAAVLHELRTTKRQTRVEYSDDLDVAARGWERDDVANRDAARWLLRGLTRRQRGIVTDFMHGMTAEMIGRRMGLSERGARHVLRTALAGIRERKGVQ